MRDLYYNKAHVPWSLFVNTAWSCGVTWENSAYRNPLVNHDDRLISLEGLPGWMLFVCQACVVVPG